MAFRKSKKDQTKIDFEALNDTPEGIIEVPTIEPASTTDSAAEAPVEGEAVAKSAKDSEPTEEVESSEEPEAAPEVEATSEAEGEAEAESSSADADEAEPKTEVAPEAETTPEAEAAPEPATDVDEPKAAETEAVEPEASSSHIDDLFAEVSAEYEAAQARDKAEKLELVADLDEPQFDEPKEDMASSEASVESEQKETVPAQETDEDQATTELPQATNDVLIEEPAVETQPTTDEEPSETEESAEDAPLFDVLPETPRTNPTEAPVPPTSIVATNTDAEPKKTSAAFDVIREYANKGFTAAKEGISAVRNLSEAKHAHAAARDALEELTRHHAELSDELEYRRNIADNFEAITAEQTAEIEAANQAFSEASGRKKIYEDQLVEGNAYLDKLKAANIAQVAPYRDVANSAKNVLDQAEQAYHTAHSNLRIAKSQHRDAINSQESQTSSATRAVESAAARLAELQDAFTQMKRDPSTGAKELTDTNRNVGSALAQLENAKAKLADVTRDTAANVANAEAQLEAQEQYMSQAEAVLAEAQRDERDKREQYEHIRKNADADEKDIASQLDEIDAKMQQADSDQEAANKRIAAAQATIASYKDVQAHPEVTEDLAKQVEETQAQIEAQQSEVDRLAEQEENLTQTTQNVRITLFAAAAVLVVILILIIWLCFIR